MATRIISSPGVEIRERDLSLIAPQNVGTNVFITGYAAQGPIDEVLKISSRDELVQIYGTPTNSAERYFFHGIRELLNSPANIYTSRLPYGPNNGVGFGSEYSALVYPVKMYQASTDSVTTNLEATSGVYVLGSPVQVRLTEQEFIEAREGSLFNWSKQGSDQNALSSISDLGKAGIIVLNKAQTTINSQFEGYYLGMIDNATIDPSKSYRNIQSTKTVANSSKFVGIVLSTTLATDQLTTEDGTPIVDEDSNPLYSTYIVESPGSEFTTIPTGTLQFSLTSTPTGISNSVSQVMQNLTNYDIDGREDDDVLNIGVFKLRKSLYATDTYKLDYVLEDAIVGSIDSHRTQNNPYGGPAVSFFLENTDNKSRNVEVLVNPYLSNKYTNSAMGDDGKPKKKIRLLTHDLEIKNNPSKSGIPTSKLEELALALGYADSLFPIGTYTDTILTNKQLGSIPGKVERALEAVKNDEIYDIDIVVEAGLGTMHVVTQSLGTSYYDDEALVPELTSLQTSDELDQTGADIRGDYSTVFNIFENFCNLPSNTGGRGDCVFIADPIRQLLITGKGTKVLSDRNKNFQQHVYWPIRHQFSLENTSYAAVYANWAQVYDEYLGDKIWVPFSSVAASNYARSDAAEFFWSAPAGYNRGLVSGNVVDIAITPNQKQRDELYKSNINPVLFSPSQGIAIFGQKTLQRKPSAFDRINVRRLFLALERPTKKASMFFVFEPNNEFTRTRFVNTLTPIFEYAKQNGGLYDYLIVCDERNNTPEVIDNNEMKADIFIKPTRTAEYIIVQFTATRTDANFQELI